MKALPFQDIYEIMAPQLPDDWQKVVLYMRYEEASFVMKYYVKDSTGKYVECFKLKDIKRKDIINAFIEIDGLIDPIRQNLKEKDKWTLATVVINSNGKFKCDFVYEDVNEASTAWFNKWKKKYLVA